MKKKNTHTTSLTASFLAAVVAFIALSVFANGLVVVSPDVGFFSWLRDVLTYGIGYKFVYKLAASVVIGFVAYFAATMIAYHRYCNARRRLKTTTVRFTPPIEAGESRIA